MHALIIYALLAAPAVHRAQAAPPHHVISAAGPLDKTDLITIVETLAATPADQFSADPTAKYVGREFTVDLPEHQDLASKYDRETQTLTITTLPSERRGYALKRVEHDDGDTVGQNAYGATIKFSRDRTDTIAVQPLPGSVRPTPVVKALDGEAARALSNSVHLRLKGVLGKADSRFPGRPAELMTRDVSFHAATLTEPNQSSVTTKKLNARVTRIELVDGRDGSTVLAWSANIPTDVTTVLKASQVKWVREPSREEIEDVAPERAVRVNQPGSASLICEIRKSRPANCASATESPPDFGFAGSAYKLLPRYLAPDADAHGDSLEGRKVEIEYRYPPR